MRHLADVIHGELHWKQPRLFDSSYELAAGDDVVATLSFRSTFGSFATAETADGSWTFKRVGFWRTRATVRESGAPNDLAVFEHDTWSGGGTLSIAGGPRVQVTTNFWQSRIEFQFEDGTVLFRYEPEGIIRHGAALTIEPAGARMRELPWLLAFGWYLVVMIQHDMATTAVVIS
jgi:hypothetical protein